MSRFREVSAATYMHGDVGMDFPQDVLAVLQSHPDRHQGALCRGDRVQRSQDERTERTEHGNDKHGVIPPVLYESPPSPLSVCCRSPWNMRMKCRLFSVSLSVNMAMPPIPECSSSEVRVELKVSGNGNKCKYSDCIRVSAINFQ